MIDIKSNSVSSDLTVGAGTEFEIQLNLFNSKAESLREFFESKLSKTTAICNDPKTGTTNNIASCTTHHQEPVLSTIQEIKAFKEAELKRLGLDYIPGILAEQEVI